jgi:outer membrane protein insertion porin family
MYKIFITSLFFFIFSFPLKSEIVKELNIDGNSRISNETIKIYGKIELNKNYSENDLNQVIKNLYSTNFFENITIELKNNILKLNLKEYPIVNQLVIFGENSNNYKKEIRKVIKLKEKSPFIKSFLAKDIDIIKQLYSSAGYNFSKVEAKVKKIDNKSIDLIFQVDKGEKTKISKITFTGNEKIRSKRLIDVIASEEHKFWKVITKNTNLSENLISLDKRLLSNYYKSLGFYDVKINSSIAQLETSSTANLSYAIEEGNRYIINKISTNVDKVFDKKIFFPLNKVFKNYVGDYYSPFKIKKLLDEIDDLIEVNNLQFVEHNVEEKIENNSINIVFNVFEGDKVLVERINIKGNNITNEDVIRGELILDEGDPFTELDLNKSIAEIKSRNIFRDVNYEVIKGSKNNLKIINIEVTEKPTGEISAGAGIGTNGGSFAVAIKENNWLGEGKSVGFELEVDAESLSGIFSYTNPNYDFLGNSITYSISSEDNDKPDLGYENSIIAAGVGTSFEQYKDVTASLGLNASYDDLRTESSASESLKKQAGNFSELAGNYGFTLDTRDRSFMPTRGSVISFGQSFPIYADKSFIANTLTGSKYKTINEDIIGASKFYIAAINGMNNDDVRLSKRKVISSRRLRGFQKNKVGPVDGGDHIGGNYATALNFEANLPKVLPESTKTDINLFLDFANVWGVDYDSSLDNSNKLRSSTGVAASWISPLGPMTFTFSQNLSKADTDKTESFSFNLGASF